jgi:hypothetical protein
VESMGGARLKARETPPDVWAIVPLVMKGPTTVLTHRGLSPHQFTPMSGAHYSMQRMGASRSGQFEFVGARRLAPTADACRSASYAP